MINDAKFMSVTHSIIVRTRMPWIDPTREQDRVVLGAILPAWRRQSCVSNFLNKVAAYDPDQPNAGHFAKSARGTVAREFKK